MIDFSEGYIFRAKRSITESSVPLIARHWLQQDRLQEAAATLRSFMSKEDPTLLKLSFGCRSGVGARDADTAFANVRSIRILMSYFVMCSRGTYDAGAPDRDLALFLGGINQSVKADAGAKRISNERSVAW
ncbi:hypothetical protein AB7828_29670 [Tardiphaga sp. 215_C5_N2_1]|uniref:hypothetical protein n=1 Tax=Tardiphaga sp. 215_C5_N2_1 TaxID=3240774 RepID=UPI003F89CDE1